MKCIESDVWGLGEAFGIYDNKTARFVSNLTISGSLDVGGNVDTTKINLTSNDPNDSPLVITHNGGGVSLRGPFLGRTLEAPIPKMSGLVRKVGPFSKRKNPL